MSTTTETKRAPDFCKRAAELMEERGRQYDKPQGERSMAQTIRAFNAITGRNLTESEGWLVLLLLKQVRLFQRPGFHRDSAEDIVAYGALLAEAKQNAEATGMLPNTPPSQQLTNVDEILTSWLGKQLSGEKQTSS